MGVRADHRRRFSVTATIALAGLLAIGACLGDVTGSGRAGRAQIDFGLAFQGTGSVADEIARLHITVTRVIPLPSTVVVDETRDFDDPGRGVDRSVAISIPLDGGASAEFDVIVDAANSSGEILFRVGPIRFTARDLARGGATRSATMEYVGPGSDATRIVASPLTLELGQSARITAQVLGPNDAVLDRAPLEWSIASGDDVVTVDQNGLVTAGTRVGLATVLVKALTPLAPSTTVNVVVVDARPTLELVSGGGQTWLPGSALPEPVVVRVVRSGAPAAGVTVTFAGGSVSPTIAVSDANGLVQASWTLAPTLGPQSLNVTATNADPLEVGATAVQAALELVSGGGQTAVVGSALAQPVIVRLMVGSTPVSGRAITFSVTMGGGSVSQTTANTDANGRAQTNWTLGVFLGAQAIEAISSGATGSPLGVGATGTADTRQVFVLSVVPSAFQPGENAIVTVFVRASANNSPVGGAQVTLNSTGTGNSFTPQVVTTGANGTAQSTFTSSTTEAKNVSATSGSTTSTASPVAVAVQNTTGTSMIKVSGDNQQVVYGTTFPQAVVVRVLNAQGLPVQNAFVDFASAQGELRRATNANGEASLLYSLPADPESYPPNTPLPITVRLVGTAITVTFTFTPVFAEPGGAAAAGPGAGLITVAPPVPPKGGGP